MIRGISIFTRGGVVVWSYFFGNPVAAPINHVIKSVFLEEHHYEGFINYQELHITWKLINDINSIAVLLYDPLYGIGPAKSLLEEVVSSFSNMDASKLNLNALPLDFANEFISVLNKAESNNKIKQIGQENRVTKKKTKANKDNEHELRERGVHEYISESNKITKKLIKSLDCSAPEDSLDSMPDISPISNSYDKIERVPTMDQIDYQPLPAVPGKDAAGLMSWSIHKIADRFKELLPASEITKESINQEKKKIVDILTSKNVSIEVAKHISESIALSVEGKKKAMFSTQSSIISESFIDAIARVLSPKDDLDFLAQVRQAKRKGKIFSIAFTGVNGVGKSTTLAKICYLLQKNNYKVMIVACDTFRSGAIEQLRIHAKKLNAALFEQGYGMDPADVCKNALEHALNEKMDVVLIDTAGRMQDNEPLMRALSRLVHVNNPDLVLFVGEALVGNDAIDQLNKFNSWIQKSAQGTKPSDKARSHGIDGIILTKFDTVNDKVGAALSMVYITKKPIYFIGIGQDYRSIEALEPERVAKILLK